jgi:hypothetical protein
MSSSTRWRACDSDATMREDLALLALWPAVRLPPGKLAQVRQAKKPVAGVRPREAVG